MSDSDDDMPPPLEDMSAQVSAAQARKKQVGGSTIAASKTINADFDDGEEIRLVPKKKPETAASLSHPAITRIAPSEDLQPLSGSAAPKKPLI